MSLENLPVCTIEPDWTNQVTEALEWNTAVLIAQRQGPNGSGAEQRRMNRLSPRISYDLDFILTGRERRAFDLQLRAAGGSPWYVPVWHHMDLTPGELSSGSTYINLPVALGEYPTYENPGPVLILGGDFRTFELVEAGAYWGGAARAAGLYIFTDGGTVNTWPEGTKVYPCKKCTLAQQPSFTKKTSTTWTCSLRWTTNQANDWAVSGTLAGDTYDSRFVLLSPPDYSDDLSGTFERFTQMLDNTSGLYDLIDSGNRGWSTQQHRWFLRGRGQHAAMKDFIYMLAGRLTGFYLPTFSHDLVLTRNIAAADINIRVENVGYTDLGFPIAGRADIVIFLKDGRYFFNTFIGAADDGDNEVLQLLTPFGSDIAISQVMMISFLALARSDQDAIEIAHQTDNHGLGQVAATFRNISGDRDAGQWTPPALPFPNMADGACGFVPALFFTVDNPVHAACAFAALTLYGFSWTEEHEAFGDAGSQQTNLDQVYGTNADYSVSTEWVRGGLESGGAFIRGSGLTSGYRTHDRVYNADGTPKGTAFRLYYQVEMTADTNRITVLSLTVTLIDKLGGDTVQVGCFNSGDYPPLHKVGLAIGMNYDNGLYGVGGFGVVAYHNGTATSATFPQITAKDRTPVTFKFTAHIDFDGHGGMRVQVDSEQHGTSIIMDGLTCFESSLMEEFAIYKRVDLHGRADDGTAAVYPSSIAFKNLIVMT